MSLKSIIKRSRWQIGFLDNPQDILKQEYKVHWLKGAPEDRWFADPFILDVTDESIEVLVEEVRFSNPTGRVTKLTVNRQTWELEKMTVLLELDTHLSFPAIRREGNEVFVYPENNYSGKLTEYKLIEGGGNELIFNKIVSSLPLTDAIQSSRFQKPIVLASKIDDECGNCLSIYKQDEKGEYIFDYDICFDRKIGRMAGDLFEIDGKLYRPAQDCSNSYGGALVIQEFKSTDPIELYDVIVHKSTHPKYIEGMHTFNMFKGVGVIDVIGYDYPRTMSVIRYLKSLCSKK